MVAETQTRRYSSTESSRKASSFSPHTSPPSLRAPLPAAQLWGQPEAGITPVDLLCPTYTRLIVGEVLRTSHSRQTPDPPPKAHALLPQVNSFSDLNVIVGILARQTPSSHGRASKVTIVKKWWTGTQSSGTSSRRKWEQFSMDSFPNNLSDKAEAQRMVQMMHTTVHRGTWYFTTTFRRRGTEPRKTDFVSHVTNTPGHAMETWQSSFWRRATFVH